MYIHIIENILAKFLVIEQEFPIEELTVLLLKFWEINFGFKGDFSLN